MFRNLVREIYRKVIFRISLNIKCRLTPMEAEKKLQRFLKREKPFFEQNNTIDEKYDLMIIVPVYNTSAFVSKCIESILEQKTSFRYLVVVVNDGSTDDSMEYLKKYEKNKKVKIIDQYNQGLSAARNVALTEIVGKYVMFVDSDDYLPADAVESLMQKAVTEDADIVEGGHILFDSNGERELVRHKEENQLFGYAWGKVIHSRCLKKFCFPRGYLYEDTVMSTLLYPMCKNILVIPEIVYYYRVNLQGITCSSGEKKESVDTFWIMKFCLEERVRKGQILGEKEYWKYLASCRRNWGRTKKMPIEIQEYIFVLTCDLFEKYLDNVLVEIGSEQKYDMLNKTIKKKSFKAFMFVMKRWDTL